MIRMSQCSINIRQPNGKLLTEENLWVLVIFLEISVKLILGTWCLLGKSRISWNHPGMLWEKGNWAAWSVTEGGDQRLLICYYVSLGCTNMFLKGAEGPHSWVWLPLVHRPQRGSWPANARTLPLTPGVSWPPATWVYLQSRRNDRNQSPTTSSLKKTSAEFLQAKFLTVPFQPRPRERFYLVSNSTLLVKGGAWKSPKC